MHFNTFAAKGVIQLPVTSCSRRDLSVAAALAANGIGREEGDGSAQRGRSVICGCLVYIVTVVCAVKPCMSVGAGGIECLL